MATLTRENIGTLHDKITVKLAKEDYMPSFDKTLKQYAKTATVPGFRKGMVPTGMLRKMYGQSILNEEVVRAAGKELEDYMREQKMSIFAQPMILPDADRKPIDINSPAEIDFAFEVGIKPEFEIPALTNGTVLTRYKIAAADKMLDDEIERIKRRFGKIDEQTVANAKEDIIYAEYTPCDADGNATGEKVEDTRAVENMPAKLGEMMMGKHPGDSVTFVPADVCTEEELKGLLKTLKAGNDAANSNYKLTITKVGHLIPADMNQELYAQVFPNTDVKDEADFRGKISDELGREFNRLSSERLQNEIFELLVHSTPIELPVTFLKRWMREGGEKPKSVQEVENEFSSFEHQLRWQLISDKIMMDNNINVSREEVNNDIKGRVLQYFGLGLDEEDEAPWMDNYMAKITKDDKMMDETFRRLLFAKLFQFLENKFPTEEKEVSEEEFFKLPNAHDAHHHH